MKSMKSRIWMKKLMFVHHVRQLKAGVLAKQVWEEQVKEGFSRIGDRDQGYM